MFLAANCFWQEGMLSNKIAVNNGLYKIAKIVQKYNTNSTVIDYTQIVNVINLLIIKCL